MVPKKIPDGLPPVTPRPRAIQAPTEMGADLRAIREAVVAELRAGEHRAMTTEGGGSSMGAVLHLREIGIITIGNLPDLQKLFRASDANGFEAAFNKCDQKIIQAWIENLRWGSDGKDYSVDSRGPYLATSRILVKENGKTWQSFSLFELFGLLKSIKITAPVDSGKKS